MLAARTLALSAALIASLASAPGARANHSFPATYTGTNATGSRIEFDVNADGSAITRVVVGNLPAGGCSFGETTTTGSIPIANHAFSTGSPSSAFQFSGTFHAPQAAQGSVRVRTVDGSCDSGPVSWSASTTAPPPGPSPGPGPAPGPAPDTTVPRVTVAAARSQRLSRRGTIRIRVGCPTETCTAGAFGRVSVPGAAATFGLSGPQVEIAQGATALMTLRVSRRGLPAVRRALADGRRVIARVTVTAADAAENRTSARRRIRLRQ